MRISELEERLAEIREKEGDISIYVSSDEEGNDFRVLYEASAYWMHLENHTFAPVNYGDVGTEFEEDKLFRGVVLWP